MQAVNGVLASYGTGRMGRLGCEGLSKTPQSMNSRSGGHETSFSEASGGPMETRALLHAYERYKDHAAGCDQYFQFYRRRVPLANIDASPNSKKGASEAARDELAHIVGKNESFDCLGCVTVCDDSIVPPRGPGTRIRSHLLEPNFSIVDGHLRIAAAKLAKEKGHLLPDSIVIEVAVPNAGALQAETEQNLLQLAVRLNRGAEDRQISDKMNHRDLRRVDFMRRFLNANPEFQSMTVDCLGKGMIGKAASKAIEIHAIPGDTVGRVHLERYVRVALLFKSAPEAYNIYKREALKSKDGTNYISIVTLNSGIILRSEPAVRPLLVECVCVYGNTRRHQIKKPKCPIFIKNIISIYEGLKKTAQRLGFSKETFLNVEISVPNGRKDPQRSTVREAIVAAATSKAMCTVSTKVRKVAAKLQASLKVALGERKSQGSPAHSSAAVTSLSPIEQPLHKSGTSSRKNSLHRSHKLQGEETTSMSLAHADQEIKRPGEESSADSPKLRSDEEEVEPQQANSALGEHRGRKRTRSPEPTSILRRKLLKRSSQRFCLEASNCDVDSRDSHLDVHGQVDDAKDGKKRNSVYRSKDNANNALLPNSLSSVHQGRRHFNRFDVERLRTELQELSSAARSVGIGTLHDVSKDELPELVRRCTQFVSFWSKHRAAIDEQGYTLIELPCPTLTSAIRNLLRSAGRTGQNNPEELGDVEKTEGENCGRSSRRMCHSANVAEQHQQNGECAEYHIAPVKVGWTRMMVETALVSISEWLDLHNASNGKLGQTSFLTRAEMLSTPGKREALQPRLAFGLRCSNRDKEPWLPQRDPPYAFIVSGDAGFPMWVWERTHVLLRSPDELLPLIAKSIKPRRVFVKPQSVLICRGDVVHAFENTYGVDGQGCANPVAVMCHLIQCEMDRQKLDETEGWWTKYIVTPGS